MKLVLLTTLFLLVGCDGTESAERADSTIVLKCTGQEIESASSERKPTTYLIRLDPNDRFQEALHYYDFEKLTFESANCGVGRKRCQLSVTPGVIEEHVFMIGEQNRVIPISTTHISRSTGQMRTYLPSHHGSVDQTTFEGNCVKSDIPAAQAQKF
jgi:hypothetical protein